MKSAPPTTTTNHYKERSYRMIRKTLAIVLGLLTVLMGAVTLTAPMIAATGPAILTVALAVFAVIAWPRKPKVKMQT
jgi:uncharacterized membrane protein HdeD (DUF308 family)